MSGERAEGTEEDRPEVVSPDETVAGMPADEDVTADAERPSRADDPDAADEVEGEDEAADRATPPTEEPAREADDDAMGADPDDPDPAPGTGARAADAPVGESDASATERPGAPAMPRPRRGAAEVTAAPRAQPRRRREPVGDIEVRAQARYVRTAPRKARLVVDHIRGKSVDEAIAILTHTPRAAAEDVLKLLRSCVANAENNHELDPEDLRIGRAYVDEGPTLKRYRPRAQGRATRIRKRTSHMTITLIPKE